MEKETNNYQNYHFTAKPCQKGIKCDYLIREGISEKGIALELLKLKGFDNTMLDDAQTAFSELTQ